MTQPFSLDDANRDVTLDSGFVPDIAMEALKAGRENDLNGATSRKSPWKNKPSHDWDESAAIPAAKKSKGFLPEVRMPYPLPPEPVAIADMANMFGVTHRTLHFYEEKKILSSRRSGLMRIYSHNDVHRMAVVNLLREVGVTVAAVQEIMEKLGKAASQEEADDIFHLALETRKRELTSEISTVQRQIQQISDFMTVTDDDTADDGVATAAIALTAQEQQCLELMAEGYAPVRLTRTLGISTEDLQRIETELLNKFAANNRFQVVAKAVVMGIIQP